MNDSILLKSIIQNINDGFALHRIITDDSGQPVDYEFVDVNTKFEQIFALKLTDIKGKRISEVYPNFKEINSNLAQSFMHVALNGGMREFTEYVDSMDKWYDIKAFCPEKQYFIVLVREIPDESNEFLKVLKQKQALQKFAQYSLKLNESTTHIEAFEILINILEKEFPKSYILLNFTDNSGRYLVLKSIIGVNKKLLKTSQKVLGFNPIGKKYEISDEIKDFYQTTFLRRFDRGLYDFSKSAIPRIAAETIEKIFGINAIYSLGMKSGDDFIGNIHFFSKREYESYEVNFIESIIHHASSVILSLTSQEKFIESEKRWKFALEGNFSGVWDWNIETNEVYFSEQWKKMHGYDDKEITSSFVAWKKRVHPDDLRIALEETTKCIEGKIDNFSSEHRVLQKDGSYKWVLDRGIVVERDEEGNAIRMIGTHTDISDRKAKEEALRESREQYMLAVNGTHDGIWDWDIKNDKLYLSKRWKEILGYKENELENNFDTFERLLHPDDRTSVFNLIDDYFKGKVDTYSIELRMKHKDGFYRWILAKGEALRNEKGEPFRMAGSHSDITDRKDFEKQLLIAKEQAESANKAKSEFLANMSHEIRTPMNSILGFSEVLLNSVDNHKHIGYLNTILKSGKTLLSLINDILDLSKIEAGRLDISPEPVDLKVVINQMNQLFSKTAQEKGLEFFIDIDDEFPASVIIDEVRIQQVLLNLIGNAIKFTEKGHVKVRLSLLGDKNGIVDFSISVIDTGIGIPKEAHEKIFDSFSQQTGQSVKKYGGTGLGLTIIKKLCEMMHGEISLISTPGKGSNFTITFKNIKYSNENIEEDDDYSWNEEGIIFKGSLIMVVDDIKYNRDLVLSYLEKYELNFLEADDGSMAYKFAEANLPDLILMDIRMPIMGGYEATKKLKENYRTKDIPIIALTASTMKNDTDKISEMFDGYLRKPIQKKILLKELIDHLPYDEIENDSPRKETKEEEIDITKIHISDEVKEKFHSSVGKNINELTEMMIIDEVNEFADELIIFIEENNIIEINQIANKLKQYISEFEFSEAKKTLEEINNIFKI